MSTPLIAARTWSLKPLGALPHPQQHLPKLGLGVAIHVHQNGLLEVWGY
jgi:hypothetical protein